MTGAYIKRPRSSFRNEAHPNPPFRAEKGGLGEALPQGFLLGPFRGCMLLVYYLFGEGKACKPEFGLCAPPESSASQRDGLNIFNTRDRAGGSCALGLRI